MMKKIFVFGLLFLLTLNLVDAQVCGLTSPDYVQKFSTFGEGPLMVETNQQYYCAGGYLSQGCLITHSSEMYDGEFMEINGSGGNYQWAMANLTELMYAVPSKVGNVGINNGTETAQIWGIVSGFVTGSEGIYFVAYNSLESNPGTSTQPDGGYYNMGYWRISVVGSVGGGTITGISVLEPSNSVIVGGLGRSFSPDPTVGLGVNPFPVGTPLSELKNYYFVIQYKEGYVSYYIYKAAPSGSRTSTIIAKHDTSYIVGSCPYSYCINKGDKISSFGIASADVTNSRVFLDNIYYSLGNNLPSVSNVEILPTVIDTETTAQCVYDFCDNDGDLDQSRVEWYVNDVFVSNSTYLSGGSTSVGSRLKCKVTPYDGLDYGSSQSYTVTVVAPPGDATQFQIYEQFIEDKTTHLNCSWKFKSLVGTHTDASTYRWTVNGFTKVTYNNANLPVSQYSDGDTVRCYVTPSDGNITYAEEMRQIIVGVSGITYNSRAFCLSPDSNLLNVKSMVLDETQASPNKLVVSDINEDDRADFFTGNVYDFANQRLLVSLTGNDGWALPFDINSDQLTDIVYKVGNEIHVKVSEPQLRSNSYSDEACLSITCDQLTDNRVIVNFLASGPTQKDVIYRLYPDTSSTFNDPHYFTDQTQFEIVSFAPGQYTAKGVVLYNSRDRNPATTKTAEATCIYQTSSELNEDCNVDEQFDYSGSIENRGWFRYTGKEMAPLNFQYLPLSGSESAGRTFKCIRNKFEIESSQVLLDDDSILQYSITNGTIPLLIGTSFYDVEFSSGNVKIGVEGVWTKIGTYVRGQEIILKAVIERPTEIKVGKDNTAKITFYINGELARSFDTTVTGTDSVKLLKLTNFKGVAKVNYITMSPSTGSIVIQTNAALSIERYAQGVTCDFDFETTDVNSPYYNLTYDERQQVEFDVVETSCLLRGSDSYNDVQICTIDDLKLFLKGSDSDSKCFNPVLNYCSEISMPNVVERDADNNLKVDLPINSNKYAAACSTELLLESAGSVGIPMLGAGWAFAQKNIAVVLVLIVILVIVFSAKSKKN